MRLKNDFFNKSTLTVAQNLLGCFLIRKIGRQTLIGKIIETEAYKGFADKASHASKGKTNRNAVMFGPAGYSYIYLIYGMYYCLNFTTEKINYPAAVLIRALEPISGIKNMMRFRQTKNLKNLCSGPGKLCQAFNITQKQNHQNLGVSKNLYLLDKKEPLKNRQIIKSSRVGVDYAQDYKNKLWRFYLKDNQFISKK